MTYTHIFIVAGEPSGDLHASNLVAQLKELMPSANLKFRGMGGDLMRRAGVELVVDAASLALIGVIEVIRHIGKIYRAMQAIKRDLIANRPQLLILVDYPGFNLRLAKIAKKLGIKVLYYISPKVWASRPGRIKQIKRYVDMMAVIFPFEVELFRKAGVPVTLVRHPLLDIVKPTMERHAAQQAFNLDAQKLTIGLFPGSRKNEIRRLLPVMLEAAQQIRQRHPDVQFILPLAASLRDEDIAPYLLADSGNTPRSKPRPSPSSALNVKVIKNLQHDVANVCDAIIAASGTATLEIALLGVPLVIIYKLAAISYWLMRWVVTIPYVGLCNIVAEKKIVQELLQHDATSAKISAEICKILEDANYRSTMINELRQVKLKLLSNQTQPATTAIPKIGEVVAELLSGR
jgi:lipid-A-disaccharide synthase